MGLKGLLSPHYPDQNSPICLGRDTIFNLASVVDWQVITSEKQWQLDIDNIRENARRVTHDYTIFNKLYVEMTGIYQKLDYSKQGQYIIT